MNVIAVNFVLNFKYFGAVISLPACLQWFDIAGWATGRASSRKN